jgi:hypothetical protein
VHRFRIMRTLLALFASAFVAAWAGAGPEPVNAAPYVPSPQSVVIAMLKLAGVGPRDFVIDLGSGDGRVVLTAARMFGARGLGVEIDASLVRQANAAARREGLGGRVRFLRQDLFRTDLARATVITMYLLPDTVNLLRAKLLAELRPGARVVSHDYPLADWPAEQLVRMNLNDKIAVTGVTTTFVYLYIVPARVAGRWLARVPARIARGPIELELEQRLTRVTGRARIDGLDYPLVDVHLKGIDLSFRLAAAQGARFTGVVRGPAIEGVVETHGAKSAWRARRR